MTVGTAAPRAGGDGGLYPDLAGLGGFFTLLAPPPPGTDAVPWAEVLAPDVLTARFVTVRQALAAGSGLPVDEVDPKVAVSATQVGLASRLWSVALAATALHRWVPDLSASALVASPVHRGDVPLGLTRPDQGYAVATTADAVAVLTRTVVEDSLARLHEACATIGRTPERVLVSNSSSALVGAARVLARHRPDASTAAWQLVRALVEVDAVAAGGAVVPKADLHHCVGGAMEHRDEAFLRSGCCVFYRLPGHGLCPDCVLAPSRPDEVTGDH